MSREHDVLDLWLDGRRAGQLFRGEAGQVEFHYDSVYRGDPESTPLSISMPKATVAHGPDRVMPWLSNLLPDAMEVRDRWAAKFGERRNDPFTLLRHMGQDAPGSVQVVPEGVTPESAGVLSQISATRIAERVEGILADPEHWVDDDDEDESRFSLGGNQGKFALARIGEEWFEPNGRAASTHIVKPGMATVTGVAPSVVQAVEFATMRAARLVGVPAAAVEIVDFAGVHAFVTTRYDRQVGDDGTIVRVHQEDFCQALGVLPSRKYEDEGGPSMADMVRLVREASSPSYRARDQRMLTRLVAFNLLIAGVDAHAKNHSLLLAGRNVRLAPAYDLISAHGVWATDRIRYKATAAVKYGKTRRFRSLTGRDLARTADVLGEDREEFAALLRELAGALPGAFEAAVGELPSGSVSERVLRLPERVRAFANDVVGRVDTDSLTTSMTPRFEPPGRAHALGTGGEVWVPGRWVRDSWRSGHYRSRASAPSEPPLGYS